MAQSPAAPRSKKHKQDKTSSTSTLVHEAPTTLPEPSSKKRKLTEEGDAASSSAEDVVEQGAASAEGDASAEKELSKADKGKLKKRRKEEQRALENPPSFSFDTRGFKGGRMIQVKDVRDFALHLLSDEKAQQWLYVSNKRNVRRVVAVMVPGITPPTLGVPAPALSANLPFSLALPAPVAGAEAAASTSLLPVFQSLFSHACPTRAPGEKNKMHSCYQAFTNCPLTGGEKERRERARKEQGQLSKTTDPSVYLMTTEQMTEQAYPVPTPLPSPLPTRTEFTFEDWKRPDGWIEAPYVKPSGKPRKVLGLDCEMCLTEDGSELTRVSVVDATGKRIYDSLVKPDKPILDYLTQYSGLNAESLAPVTTRLIDIQKALTSLFDYNTILLGHSLECDLRVLKLVHSHVIDTSVIYQHPRGPPFKASLKWLASKWLKKDIQNAVARGAGLGGHDSEEDARTCVDLLNLKMQKGPGFGEFATDQETIFERIARGPEPKTSAVVDHGTPGQWHGAKAKTAIACTSDEEVLQGMLNSIGGHEFILGRFMDLSHALGWSQPSNAALGKNSTNLPGISASSTTPSTPLATDGSLTPTLDTTPSSPSAADILAAHAELNKRLATLHAALPPLTALVVFTGHGDPKEMARLTQKKAKFDRLWKTVKQSEIEAADRWMAEDDRKLIDEVERCRMGLSFYCMK